MGRENRAQAVIGYLVVQQLDKYATQRATSGTPEGNYDEGLRYLRAGDETHGVEFLKKSADSDYSVAQCVLGDLAFKNVDYPKARERYEKAAVRHSHSWAQFQLGNLAAYGYLSSAPDYRGPSDGTGSRRR
jgi:TPR repeat protein